AEAGDRIPAGGSAVTGNARGLVVAGGHVEEVCCVLGRGTRDLIEGRGDGAEVASLHLVGERGERGPLRGAGARAAGGVPAGAARVRAAATGVPSGDGGPAEVHEHPGACARLIRDVGDAAHVRVRAWRSDRGADEGAPGRQGVLERRAREEDAVTASGVDPADLAHAGICLPVGRRRGAVDGRPRGRVHTEVGAADARHELVGGHATLGYGMTLGVFNGCLITLVVPPSPLLRATLAPARPSRATPITDCR